MEHPLTDALQLMANTLAGSLGITPPLRLTLTLPTRKERRAVLVLLCNEGRILNPPPIDGPRVKLRYNDFVITLEVEP